MTDAISVDDAVTMILDHCPDRGSERIPLDQAAGRILAAPVTARITQPPLPVSAMDGYAVRRSDVAGGEAVLRLIGEAPAGRPFEQSLGPGDCVRIFTGGALPDGADCVVIQERVSRDDDTVRVPEQETGPSHVRKAGIDFAAGDTLISQGTRLEAPHVAIAAAANHANVTVQKRLQVAFLANGDELRPPGHDLSPGQIVASSHYALASLVQSWGDSYRDLGIAPDRADEIRTHITQASDADVIVPIGGASVGEHDHMKAAFDALGFQMIFSRVAVRPGKPTWFAQKEHQLVLGLPGNPASSLVCAHLFLRPLLTRQQLPTATAITGTALSENGPRRSFLRANARIDSKGLVNVFPSRNQDSSLLRPFLLANALIDRAPNASACDEGTEVTIRILGEINDNK
ncbi:MAG: molybdopterin molybdotransferase MoeA [Pseudomonadota bacterium]